MKKMIFNSPFILSLYSAFFALTIFSCEAQKITPSEAVIPSEPTNSRHVSQNSVDYDGIYRGTLPCSDCAGIKTTIYVMRDYTFKAENTHLGKNPKSFTTTGKYIWNKDGTVMILRTANAETRYSVEENTLTQLDASGKKITGNFASKYILTKDNYAILHRKWRLMEIMGKPVTDEQTMNKGAFLQFLDSENRFSATAGCNTISGSFTTESFNRLKLGTGISTMMACGDMTLENDLKKVLGTADAFQLNGNDLILTKGKMAPLARFIAPVN